MAAKAGIRRVQTQVDIAEIRTLFAEYPTPSASISYSRISARNWQICPAAISEPRGRLLLGVESNDAPGCVGVRPFVEQICELKRH